MLSTPKCQHLFSIFFDFFKKSDFLFLKKSAKPDKYKALRAFHFFQKNRFFGLQKGFFYWFLRFFVKKYFFRTIKKS
ncbi:MAG: hypothetical protein EGP80_14850 [Blautia wexlerae]|nr:hypothetical protein [Blautia wexlerae]